MTTPNASTVDAGPELATSPATAAKAGPAALPTPLTPTIGSYLIERLHEMGVDHVFGIPGDYILTLYKMLEASPIELVGMTREDSAGFAADAYARVKGLGCVCVTYCVGGLSACNSVAGAYAEKSPVVVLTGSPGMSERDRNPLLHHKVKEFSTQFEVFEKITVASAVLSDPLSAFSEIDRVLAAAVRYKRPVYLEIPRDLVTAEPVVPHRPPAGLPPSDPSALHEAIEEASVLLRAAKRPMILADVEIHRFGLQDDLIALAEGAGLPIATTILGKSVISGGAPAVRRRLRGGDGPRRGRRVRRGGGLPPDARLLPHGHQPGDLHRQARPVAVHRRDERGPPDPPPPLPRGPARRLRPWPARQGSDAGSPAGPASTGRRRRPWVADRDAPMTSARLFAGSTGCSARGWS